MAVGAHRSPRPGRRLTWRDCASPTSARPMAASRHWLVGTSPFAPEHRWAVLGPSGSGRSRLLRGIAGFEVLDAGEIRVDVRRGATPGAAVPARRAPDLGGGPGRRALSSSASP
ncbi:ATP-binding cassette domain-containing protein [Streptomyces sp. NPDC005181]|uniref:ATP-binding cassette domain-containing protein n=1 Tax=Streptomyces sp. NPDC005181 TaxID=3156869 RepID=UPI0033BCEA46